MKKTVLFIIFITIISKGLGFVRDLALSYFYGASYISDAYFISETIPVTILSFICVGITSGFIPIYNRILINENENKANLFLNNFLNFLMLICTVILIFCFIFSNQIVSFFASGFSEETFHLSVKLTRIRVISIYFIVLIDIFIAFLQTKDSFHISSITGIVLNTILILFIILSYYFDVILLGIGGVVSKIIQFAMLIPFVLKYGYNYNKILDFKDKNIINILTISFPLILSSSMEQVNILVDRNIASHIAIGSISILTYSDRLASMLKSILILPITMVIYSKMNMMFIKKDYKNLKNIIVYSINVLNIMIIPLTIFFIIFSKDIISHIFLRGEFDINSLNMTIEVFKFYSIGIVGFGIREIVVRVFYSMEETKLPMFNSLLGVIINIILNIVLSKYMGINGLALSTSISILFTTVILLFSLYKINLLNLKNIYYLFFKVFSVSLLISHFLKKIVYYFFAEINMFILLIVCFLFIIIYLFLLLSMNIKEIKDIYNWTKEKFKKL